MKRYTVPGWPARQPGHTAVTPHLTRMAGSGAQQYKDGVTGQPGTQAIPVKPVIPSPDIGDTAQSGLSRSGDAPNQFFPNLYYARPQRGYWPGAGMPVSVVSDNLMPVPAVDPRGIPARLSMPVVQRGQKQIRQPQAQPRWDHPVSEQPAQARPAGAGGKKILGVPRTTFFIALGGAVVVGLAFYWWRNYQAGKQTAATNAASTTDTGNVDTSGQLSTIQTELETLEEEGATTTAGSGQATGNGGGWSGGYGGSGSSGGSGSGVNGNGTPSGAGSTGSTSSGSTSSGSKPAAPSGGHVISVNNTGAHIGWNANGATKWSVKLTGPGKLNGFTNTVTSPQATYSGLESGHTYTATVTPLSATGTPGPSGQVIFVTK